VVEKPGELIAGQYRLVEEIGRGGFGVVWRARDEHLDRDVAAKMLYVPSYLDGDQLRERRERSMREARSAARLHHRAAVTVYEVVEHEGCPWIIMEFVRGMSLDALVKTAGPLPVAQVAGIGLEVLQALRSAHRSGVIHRDVKPANVLIADHRVVLTDFGIAVIDGDVSLTQSGLVMGAPAYTAPERARGDVAVAASDLWSLGATLYFAVEGHRPFGGINANAVFHAILTGRPAPTMKAGPLGPVLDGLMCKDPLERLTAEAASRLLAEILGVRTPDGDTPSDGTPAAYLVPSDVVTNPHRHLPRRRTLVLASACAATLALGGAAIWASGLAPAPLRKVHQAAPAPQVPAVLAGPFGLVNAVAVSPDGSTVAAGGDDTLIRLWNTADHRLLATLSGHTSPIFAIAFGKDGTLASADYGGQVIVWAAGSYRRAATIDTLGGSIATLAFSPDGKTLATAHNDGVRLWDLATHRLTGTFTDGRQSEFFAAYGPSGTLMTADSRYIRLRAGGAFTRLGEYTVLPTGIAISTDGDLVACGGSDGRVLIWDLRTRTRVQTLHGHGQNITAVAFGAERFATADGDTIQEWDTTTWRRTAILSRPGANVTGLAFGPRGLLAASTALGTVDLWNGIPPPGVAPHPSSASASRT
jgi:WD40 repeat protein